MEDGGLEDGSESIVQPPSSVVQIDRAAVEKQLESQLRRGRDARKEPFEAWTRNHELYNNRYDYSQKEAWQSKGYVAKIGRQTDFVCHVAREAIVRDADGWAAAEADTEIGRLAAKVLMKLGYDCLDRHGFLANLKPNMRAGLLTSGCLWAVKPASPPLYPGDTEVSPVDMRCIVRDPTGRDKWLFFLTAKDYADVARDAAAMGWDPEVVESLRDEGGEDPDRDWKTRLMGMLGLSDPGPDRKTVYLAEYYGPIYDAGGNELYPFAYAVLANGRHLLADPNPQPYGDDAGCITGRDLNPQLGAPYGKSYVDDAAGPAENQTRLYNLMHDAAPYAVKAFEVDVTRLRRRQQLKGGIRAGHVLEVTPGDGNAVRPVDLGGFDTSLLTLYQLDDAEVQAATSATNDARGLDNAKNAGLTLGEVQLKAEANDRNLNAVTMDFEDQSLSPMWTRLLYMIGRYVDLTDPRVREIAGDEIRQALSRLTADGTPVELALLSLQKACRGRFTVRVRGLSTRLRQKQRAIAAVTTVKALQAFGLSARIDPDKAFELLCQVNDLDPEEVGYSDDEWKRMREEQRQAPPLDAAGISVSFKDLPPSAQAAWLQQHGLPADGVGSPDPADALRFQAQQMETEAKDRRHETDVLVDLLQSGALPAGGPLGAMDGASGMMEPIGGYGDSLGDSNGLNGMGEPTMPPLGVAGL